MFTDNHKKYNDNNGYYRGTTGVWIFFQVHSPDWRVAKNIYSPNQIIT
jgi:hypothetical protein